MSRNKAVFGIGILCFTAGMYFGGALAEVKRPEFPAEEQETGRTWEKQEQPPADSTLSLRQPAPDAASQRPHPACARRHRDRDSHLARAEHEPSDPHRHIEI